MTTGTTIGEISSASKTPWPGKRARHSPSAASVPRSVASTVADVPTSRLFHTDGSQNDDVKKSAYQRKLKPGSGYWKNEPDENDSGTMMTIGAMRNTSTVSDSTASAARAT